MRFLLNLNQSLDAIRANMLRAGITIFIIALGITALVVVMTSIEGVKSAMMNSFSSLGSNTFKIQNVASQVMFHGGGGQRVVKYPAIDYRDANSFKQKYGDLAIVSVSGSAGGAFTFKYRENTTNSNVQIMGVDENYLKTARYDLAEGRSLSEEDILLGKNVMVIGSEVKDMLFPYESSIGKYITADGNMYKVIGAFAKMGSSGMFGGDKIGMIPVTTARNHFPNMGSLTLNIFANDANRMDFLIEEARGVFRIVRKLRAEQEDNFSISKSDEFVNQFLEQMKILTLSAQVIAMITLLGASIALLNVMLVSVTERTNEIGVRKAMGASRRNILLQFLFEAIVICQLGGLLGILMGLFVGNLISTLMFSTGFVVPWNWIIIGLIACLVVGVASGYYPAWKAARVDPIESLRYE
ncbi:MAG: ABC transporter permease [Bacteroidia bacterium]|nr:ABC transporter permease [Bacteroidia bacterium]